MIVFKILSKISGQHYVGSCRGDIFERWQLYLNAAEAGLDFPLYKEIREHGDAQFTIAELDFAEEISELKEMELLHTIELNARSLRGHKFGLSESVVKRRRQVAHENAWKKEIPAEDKSLTAAPVSKPAVSKPAIKKTVIKKAPLNTQPITAQQPAKPRTTAPQSSATITTTKTATKAVNSTTVTASQPSDGDKLHNTYAEQELQKTLFAESIGLLVRTLSSVEQINTQQQHAREEAESLSQALIASDNALQQLLQQQQQAAIKAEQAMAAVEASQQANQALVAAQQQALQCSSSTLNALDQNQQNLDQTQLLQQQLTELLGRLKNSSATQPAKTNPVAASPVAEPSVAAIAQTQSAEQSAPTTPDQLLSVVTRTTIATESAELHSDEDKARHQLLQTEESKMINQLKQLDQLLVQQPNNPSEATGQVMAPTRAWIAGAESATDKTTDSAQLLKQAPTPTVIRRRSRVSQPTPSLPNKANSNLTNNAQQPTTSRKRLSIKLN
ncbi:MAG: GIY-YIG nuclease family protein [Motiliproteus sp.]